MNERFRSLPDDLRPRGRCHCCQVEAFRADPTPRCWQRGALKPLCSAKSRSSGARSSFFADHNGLPEGSSAAGRSHLEQLPNIKKRTLNDFIAKTVKDETDDLHRRVEVLTSELPTTTRDLPRLVKILERPAGQQFAPFQRLLESAIVVGYVFQFSGRSRDGLEDHAELHLRVRG